MTEVKFRDLTLSEDALAELEQVWVRFVRSLVRGARLLSPDGGVLEAEDVDAALDADRLYPNALLDDGANVWKNIK